jgi:uncharacterized protein (TIGR02284 family)
MTAESMTDSLNGLIRGELSAMETYEQALKKVDDEPGAQDLRRIALEHHEAMTTLRGYLNVVGAKPDTTSGAWGTWCNTVMAASKLLGNKTALQALKTGEEYGVGQYVHAMQDDGLSATCKETIRTTLLPRQREHVQTLDRMIAQD